jgi:hypothetical protein
MNDPGVPRGRRSKDLQVWALDEDRYRFTSYLLDESFGGHYEGDGGSAVIHHFTAEGVVTGDDLVLSELTIRAVVHPFGECPLVTITAQALIGNSIADGWRKKVLGHLGGVQGCTHQVNLLLSLSDMVILIHHQRLNVHSIFGRNSLDSGNWLASSWGDAEKFVGFCHALSGESPTLRKAAEARKLQGDQKPD